MSPIIQMLVFSYLQHLCAQYGPILSQQISGKSLMDGKLNEANLFLDHPNNSVAAFLPRYSSFFIKIIINKLKNIE